MAGVYALWQGSVDEYQSLSDRLCEAMNAHDLDYAMFAALSSTTPASLVNFIESATGRIREGTRTKWEATLTRLVVAPKPAVEFAPEAVVEPAPLPEGVINQLAELTAQVGRLTQRLHRLEVSHQRLERLLEAQPVVAQPFVGPLALPPGPRPAGPPPPPPDPNRPTPEIPDEALAHLAAQALPVRTVTPIASVSLTDKRRREGFERRR